MSRVATYSGPFMHGLGDQIYDPVTGTYVDTLPASDNPAGNLFLPIEDQPYYTGDYTGPISPASQQASKAPPGTIFTPQSSPGLFPPTAVAATVTPRPSPVVSVPLSTQTAGMWLGGSSLITGFPNWLILVGGVGIAILVTSGGGRRRR